jgi:hypothetical protein
VPLRLRIQLWTGYLEQQVYEWHRAWLDKKGYKCTTWAAGIDFGVGVGRRTDIWGRWEMGSAG